MIFFGPDIYMRYKFRKNPILFTVQESRGCPQVQGIKGEAVPPLAGLRILDNDGDGASSAFAQSRSYYKEF
jgi:hypothetical protein